MSIATKPATAQAITRAARDKVMVAEFPCRISFNGDGTYRPSPDGEQASALPVYDRLDRLVDLVAWLPDRPTVWYFRHGDEISILGSRGLAVAKYFGDAIKLYATPHRWLLAGGDGAVILKWDVDHRELFDGVARVECDCPALETRFRGSLRRWEPLLTSEIRHAA